MSSGRASSRPAPGRLGRHLFLTRVALAVVAGLALAGCSGGAGASRPLTGHRHVRARGGVAYWAEPPGSSPDWIFPLMPLGYFGANNTADFQYLMYRPLYWFGGVRTRAPVFDEALSLADPPTWSLDGKSVTIRLKGWKWSNGTTVDAKSVMFFLNMVKAEKLNWAAYVPGGFPDNVTSYSADAGADTVTLHLDAAYAESWYLYDELSQITPLPYTWDVTNAKGRPGSGRCSSLTPSPVVLARCRRVWSFLTDDGGRSRNPQEGADLAGFATNPLWGVVDGPWRLERFLPDGEATFVPNRSYSGPRRPTLSRFVEVPFASSSSEYSALTAGGPHALSVGYVPLHELPRPASGPPGTVGPNVKALTGRYDLDPVYPWAINFEADNFDSAGDGGNAGAIFRQLYVRQAIQSTVDQAALIHGVDRGYGVPTYGPVPAYPPNPFASPAEAHNPYPFDPAKARRLLASHGWTVSAGGTDVCPVGRRCGRGIHDGAQMDFSLLYYSGPAALRQAVTDEASSLRRIGIHLTLVGRSFSAVINGSAPCRAGVASCSWELATWGGGWSFVPDYLPTGEEVFESGAGSNAGSYSSETADHLIEETDLSSNPAALAAYEQYLATQLPVIWEPSAASEIDEVSTRLAGATPVNSLVELMPEYWHWKKR